MQKYIILFMYLSIWFYPVIQFKSKFIKQSFKFKLTHPF